MNGVCTKEMHCSPPVLLVRILSDGYPPEVSRGRVG